MKKAIPIGAALLASIVFLIVRYTEFSQSESEKYQSALWTMRQLDTAFNQDLLRARFSMLNNYDEFDSNRLAADAAIDSMTRVPRFVEPAARASIDRSTSICRGLLLQREALVEHFKSANAIVVNSRRYLPMALRQLSENPPLSAADRDLAARSNELAHALLTNLSDAETDDVEALAAAGRLQLWIERNPHHPQVALAASVERHARTLITGTGHLDVLTAELLALPLAAGIDDLLHTYEAQVYAGLSRAQQYRLLLYLVSAAMLCIVGYVLWAQSSSNRTLERRVHKRTRELAASELRFRTLATAAPIGIFLTDAHGRSVYTNPYWQTTAGLSALQALGDGWLQAVHCDDVAELEADWARTVGDGGAFDREFRLDTVHGQVRVVHVRTAVVRDDAAQVVGHVGTVEDITERKRIAIELRQAQKLESVGRLAAGVAHEINTPVQFVSDSCHFIRDGMAELQALVGQYRGALQALAEGRATPQAALQQMQGREQAADVDYLLENMPGAIDRSLDGLQRVATIVRSMKEFAHPDQKEKAYADLNQAILSTLTIARNECKYVADVSTELGEIPPVYCFLGDLNQAVLNIVVNAAHAIEDCVRGSERRGRITVRTEQQGEEVVISIQDTGGGIAPDIADKIFDPFFTTKDVGKGTGQGLAIARSVIVDKHQGELRFDTQAGTGTTFYIRLPIQPRKADDERIAA